MPANGGVPYSLWHKTICGTGKNTWDIEKTKSYVEKIMSDIIFAFISHRISATYANLPESYKIV